MKFAWLWYIFLSKLCFIGSYWNVYSDSRTHCNLLLKGMAGFFKAKFLITGLIRTKYTDVILENES